MASIWADAPSGSVEHSKKTQRKKPTSGKNKKSGTNRISSAPVTETSTEKKTFHEEKPKGRLVFSVKDVKIDKSTPASPRKGNNKKIDNATESNEKADKASKDKLEVLKKKIENQKKILQKAQHEKQQKALLEEFLNDDAKFDWGDEDEEDEIIEKLNNSLKV